MGDHPQKGNGPRVQVRDLVMFGLRNQAKLSQLVVWILKMVKPKKGPLPKMVKPQNGFPTQNGQAPKRVPYPRPVGRTLDTLCFTYLCEAPRKNGNGSYP